MSFGQCNLYLFEAVNTVLFLSLILPLPQNVIDYLLDDGTLVVSGRYNDLGHFHINPSIPYFPQRLLLL